MERGNGAAVSPLLCYKQSQYSIENYVVGESALKRQFFVVQV